MPEPMWNIRNSYLDHNKVHLHRVAAKLETEPLIGGLRLRIRESRLVPQSYIERNHEMLERLAKSGVIEMTAPTGTAVMPAEKPVEIIETPPEPVSPPVPIPLPEDVGPYDVPPEEPTPDVPAAPIVEAAPEPQKRGRWKNRG